MKNRRFKVLATAAAAVLIVALGFAYHGFMAQKIYDENTENLISTYEQMDKTFELFAQRNWNVMADWDALLAAATEDGHIEDVWIRARSQKDSWGYRDVYLFNQNDDFITDGGRSGKAGSIDGVFQKMYEKGTPWISSYIASDGMRRIVFALPLSHPFTFGGVTYTGLAVSYDNDAVMDMVAGDVYRGKSDCYVVHQSGDVVFSLQPKSEIKPFVSNIMSYLGEHASFSRGSFDEIQRQVGHSKGGSAFCTLNGRGYYLVYQPAGIGDWSIVGLVRSDVVDSGMNEVQLISTVAIGVVGVIITALIVAVLVNYEHGKICLREHELEAKERERQMAERQKELTSKLFSGMGKVVDRFAVCDLVSDTYKYFEHQLDELAYSATGSYQGLIDQIADRFLPLSQGETLKMNQLLDAERLRDTIKDMDDIQKIEYCGRTENVYRIMNIVPVSIDAEGKVRTVMFITQDIAQRVELESMANTDGLTGLFNERCFAAMLERKERRHEPFMLFYIDLDKFKPVNDTYGHNAGDKLLQAVGKRLQRIVRADDYAFRIGGDEFTVLVSSAASDLQAQRVLERIQEALFEPFAIDGHVIEIGASCGFAHYPCEGSAEEVRILADQRMYECKERNHAER